MIFKYICAREDVVDMRSMKLPAIMMGIQLIFLGLLYFFFQRMGRKEAMDVIGQTEYYRLIFSLLLSVEYMLLVFISPYFTAKSISIERERKELDFLLMSHLRAWDIIFGKYIYALSNLFLIMFSALPFMILAWIYARIDIICILTIGILAISGLLALNAVFMLISVCAKKVYTAMFTSYIVILLLIFSGLFLWLSGRVSATTVSWERLACFQGVLPISLCLTVFAGVLLACSTYLLMPLKLKFKKKSEI